MVARIEMLSTVTSVRSPFIGPYPAYIARLPALGPYPKMQGPWRILPPLLAARFPTTTSWKNWAAEAWAWSTKPRTRASAFLLLIDCLFANSEFHG